MVSTATQWPRSQFSMSNSSSSGSITPSDIQDFDFRSVLLFLKFSISQELYLNIQPNIFNRALNIFFGAHNERNRKRVFGAKSVA